MRRVLQWTLNLAAAVLFVAFCVLWVRNHESRLRTDPSPSSITALTDYANPMQDRAATPVDLPVGAPWSACGRNRGRRSRVLSSLLFSHRRH
jgi:hypothetical protein